MERSESKRVPIEKDQCGGVCRIIPALSRHRTIGFVASLQLGSEPLRITGKQRAVRIFGLLVFPEMRLTVSFRITYTLRPVWGVGAVSEDFLFFSFHSEPHDRYHSRTFCRSIEIRETPRRD